MITGAGCSFQKPGIYETEMEQKLRRPRMKGMQMFQFQVVQEKNTLKNARKKESSQLKITYTKVLKN